MRDYPKLRTERLVLSGFVPADAPIVERLASSFEVADTTLAMPHPYPPGVAAEWIGKHQAAWDEGAALTCALVERTADEVIGAITLTISPEHCKGELGYWVGVPFWNRGFCTEAARRIVGFAFEDLGLHRVQAHHFVRNPASGRVMEKVGMKLEGVQREALKRWDRFEDVAVYGVLASEWPIGGGV